jgi:hypothetical protein
LKNYWIFLLLAFIASSCQDFAEERLTTSENAAIETRTSEVGSADYYWYNGEKVYLTRSEKYVNVVDGGKLVKYSKAEAAAKYPAQSEQIKVLPFFERGEGVEPIGTSPDFITFLRHQIAHYDYQQVTLNNWVAQGGASQKRVILQHVCS